jgi:hypothetical protein
VKQIYAGEGLDDNDLKQLWHDVDLVRYGVNDRMARMKAEALQQYAEQQLAKQIVEQAPKSDQGEVILWGTPVREQDALGHALQDVRYFREHDRHMGPGQVVASVLNKGLTQPVSKEYPIIPPKSLYETKGYPDITQKYLEKLRGITQETAHTFNASGKAGVYYLFSKNFPNNGKWDLQVGHGLPGQVIVRDQNTGHIKYNPSRKGEALTQDQYATFRGKVVRAGYLSNYTFGQAIAAGELFDFEGVTAAQAFSILSNLKNIDLSNITASFDNPEDIKAILEGYRDYRNEHPKKLPTPGSYRNK